MSFALNIKYIIKIQRDISLKLFKSYESLYIYIYIYIYILFISGKNNDKQTGKKVNKKEL